MASLLGLICPSGIARAEDRPRDRGVHTKIDYAAEEAEAMRQLNAARVARRRAGRTEVPDPWAQRPRRVEPPPAVDILAAALAEFNKDTGAG